MDTNDPVVVDESEASDSDDRKQVVAIIRRADIQQDWPVETAWELISEDVVLPLARGSWLGNGLRIGVMPTDQLTAFSEAMPPPLVSSQTLIGQSANAVPIFETPVLSPNLQFRMDLTRPPKPRASETVIGGNNSRLRLLARIEGRADGGHLLAITPQHHIPSPFDLIPRDPQMKELDGRVFDELRLRIPLDTDQIAVVGLYWPWPEAMRREAELAIVTEQIGLNGPDQPEESNADNDPNSQPIRIESLPPADPADPAAPPKHLSEINATDAQRTPRIVLDVGERERIAPPLPLHFGSTLFTGSGTGGIAVQTLLLITIEER